MRQANNERKTFQSRISFLPDRARKFKKKNSKKIQKHHSDVISIETGMRQADKERKKFYSRIPFLPDPGKKIHKENSKIIQKIKKHHFSIISIETEIRQAEKGEKNFSPEFHSNQTRARKFQKNSKEIQEIKKHHSDIISINTGMRQAEKKKNKIQSRIPFLPNPGKKIRKKIAKKFKKLNNIILALFLSKPG